MLKNAIIYKIMPHSKQTLVHECEQALQPVKFKPTQGTQEKSVGFVPPRGDAHGSLIEVNGSNWFLRVALETRKVPSAIVEEKLTGKVQEIESATGRIPGKKEKRELKEEIYFSLLPTAFPTRGDINVWIDNERHLLIVDASSQAKADEAVTLVVTHMGLQLALIQTQLSPQKVMTQWLLAQNLNEEGPRCFAFGKELVLKADEEKAQVKYSHHSLDSEGIRPEIQKHIRQGKHPRSLELAHEEAMISFVLTESLTLKKINIPNEAYADRDNSEDDDRFDADVFLVTTLVGRVLDDLLVELGGEVAHADA